ncbi:GSCOCG00011415001-RA-CDS, partial [Cotesia congregata]
RLHSFNIKFGCCKFHQTYTLGIPIEWIRDFTLEEWEKESDDISYIVEWREKVSKNQFKKLGGWPVYDASVVAVSASLKKLSKFMRERECEVSPEHGLHPESVKKKWEKQMLGSKDDNKSA